MSVNVEHAYVYRSVRISHLATEVLTDKPRPTHSSIHVGKYLSMFVNVKHAYVYQTLLCVTLPLLMHALMGDELPKPSRIHIKKYL